MWHRGVIKEFNGHERTAILERNAGPAWGVGPMFFRWSAEYEHYLRRAFQEDTTVDIYTRGPRCDLFNLIIDRVSIRVLLQETPGAYLNPLSGSSR